jgi:hypothetical protein
VEYNEECSQLAVNMCPFWSAPRGLVYYKHAFEGDGAALEEMLL